MASMASSQVCASSASCTLLKNGASAATGGLNSQALSFKQNCNSSTKLETQQRQHQQKKNKQNGGLKVCASYSGGGKQLYQPFRPPPPKLSGALAGANTVEQQLEILRDRQGLWYQYATVIPMLTQAGFSPSELVEQTGLNGHEQNELVVGAQVRDSLIASGLEKELVDWFDAGGAQRLYELRTLSAQERNAAARLVIEKDMEAKLVRDLSRAIKDFPRRKSVEGFKSFTTAPGDCMAFALYRQSKETNSDTEIESLLNRALEYAVTEKAKAKILSALNQGDDEEEVTVAPEAAKLKVIVMRLSSDEVPVVLPVADFSAKALDEAPGQPVAPGSEGKFNILTTDSPWKSWIAIPSWRPITYAKAPVALLVQDATVLPKNLGIKLSKEPILVVVDKEVTELNSESFYLVVTSEGGLTMQSGSKISPAQTVLGKVMIALKAPLPVDPNVNTDWE
jgi:hypothetical protein